MEELLLMLSTKEIRILNKIFWGIFRGIQKKAIKKNNNYRGLIY